MKVICIKKGEFVKVSNEPDPTFGEIVTVEFTRIWMGKLVYHFKEYQYCGGYIASNFIPLSNIDETELVNKKEEVSVQ